jgi:DnaJ-class molecular chaperone
MRSPVCMSEVGKTSDRGGSIARMTRRLALLIRAAGDRLFQAHDERAGQYGWQITVRRAGLARTYRDPRFDRFRSCLACRGTGIDPAEKSCDRCGGTGRISASPQAMVDGRRGS